MLSGMSARIESESAHADQGIKESIPPGEPVLQGRHKYHVQFDFIRMEERQKQIEADNRSTAGALDERCNFFANHERIERHGHESTHPGAKRSNQIFGAIGKENADAVSVIETARLQRRCHSLAP